MSSNLLVPSFETLFSQYDCVFCDIWGVVHNGMHAHQSAVEILIKFRAQGGQVALVTNAPRPNVQISQMLAKLDVPESAYDTIVSSGDVTKDLIKAYSGQIVHHVGPDYDLNLFDDTGVTLGAPEESVAVIVSDLDEKGEDLEPYFPRLEKFLAHDLPMICANPDKLVEVGDQLVYCGGALADIYAQMGGQVTMAGKPYAPIYDKARTALEELDLPHISSARALAIGDAERTDASGAANQNLDFLFVTGSVHHELLHENGDAASDKAVVKLLAECGVNCIGHLPQLR